MTLTDLSADPVACSLMAAIDDGDDGVLPILADRLEEMGDSRAAGLRSGIRPFGNRHTVQSYGVVLIRASSVAPDYDAEYAQSAVPDAAFDRLTRFVPLGSAGGSSGPDWRRYSCLATAYLALAEALTT